MAGMNSFWLVVLAVGVTMGVRGAALVAERVEVSWFDGWGFGADAVAGLWVGALLVGLRWWGRGRGAGSWGWPGRAAAGLAMAGWVVIGSLAVEHVRTLGVWPDARQAGMLADPTFVRGSLLSPGHPWVIVVFAGLSGLAAAAMRGVRRGRAVGLAMLAALVGSVAWAVLPGAPARAGWRGTHVATANAAMLWQAWTTPADDAGPLTQIQVTAADRDVVDRWMVGDLSGHRITPPPSTGERDRPNVLLLIVEAVSGDRIAAVHGLTQERDGSPLRDEMPRLSELARESVVARRFLNQQQQTNRGTYALLAGALPLIEKGTPRMATFSALPPRPYLPGVLAAAGYRTAYVQSADLTFMGKWPFLRHAGFEQVEDAMTWDQARVRTGWGVDDVSLMEGALQRIDAFETADAPPPDADRPWFMTVLTAGTHHPYSVPEDFGWWEGENEKQRAFRYADAAVGVMLDGLRDRGLLERTVVVVTSDESGSKEDRGRAAWPVLQYWGFCMIRPPGGVGQTDAAGGNALPRGGLTNDGLYGQSDVAISVLDAAGFTQAQNPFGGRSLLRRYTSPRSLPFGAVYHRRMGMVLEDGSMEMLGEDFRPVVRYVPESAGGGRMFTDLVESPAGEAEWASQPILAELALRQRRESAAEAGRPMVMIPPGRYVLPPLPEPYSGVPIVKNQGYYSAGHSRVRVRIRLRVQDPAQVKRINMGFLDEGYRLEPSEGGVFSIDVEDTYWRKPEDNGIFAINLKAHTLAREPLTLEVEAAEVTVVPLDDQLHPVPGLDRMDEGAEEAAED